jgi:Protein of unknown function (DUF4232)
MNSAFKHARLAIAPAALTGLAMLVAACGSSATSSASSPPSSPSSSSSPASSPAAPANAVTATPATTATPAGGTSGGSGASGGKPSCPTSSLSLRTGASQGAAGSTYIELDFKNISGTTCTLYGYPGVSFTGGASHTTVIGVAANENAATPRRLVTLAPGAVAGAELRIVDARNYPIAACNTVTAHYLRVYPPNQLAPLYVALTEPTCSNNTQILTVSVVEPGAGDAS